VPILAAVAEATLTPDLVLDYLGELSTDIRAGVLLDSDGATAAASDNEGEQLGPLVAELFDDAAAAALPSETISQVEVTTVVGGVFAVRDSRWTLAVVTGRYALPSLMFYDLRSVLGDLAGAT